jgi:hypothetical protein
VSDIRSRFAPPASVQNRRKDGSLLRAAPCLAREWLSRPAEPHAAAIGIATQLLLPLAAGIKLELIATLPGAMCRFLVAGDLDGDGAPELVLTSKDSGVWLARPRAELPWRLEPIDRDSGGFEHAALVADLHANGRDELYVASDTHQEIRRYEVVRGARTREVIWRGDPAQHVITWSLAPAPRALVAPRVPSRRPRAAEARRISKPVRSRPAGERLPAHQGDPRAPQGQTQVRRRATALCARPRRVRTSS